MFRRLALRIAAVAGVVVLLVGVGIVAKAWWDSRLPGTYSVMDFGEPDFGGGTEHAAHSGHEAGNGGISVADFHGPSGEPDARYELVARSAEVELASGRVVD